MSALRTRLTGVAFLAVIVGLVYLTVLLYQKAFTPVVHVTLKADRIGNQLSPPADVKLRGLIVGEVRQVSSTGDGASLDLALDPGTVHLIPADVKARLLPKTLFGEKFVDLVAPPQDTGPSLSAGDVIPQDRSATALETEQVLTDLLPLLQTLRPAQLSETLNAVSTALRGRGKEIGGNLVALDAYLTRLDPEIPTIQKDIRGLADLSANYDEATPDVLALLDNFSAVGRNLVDEKQQLNTFLTSSTASVATIDSVLRENEDRLVQLASSSKPDLQLLARYSPEFPCLAAGLKDYEPIVSTTFGGKQPGLHIRLTPVQANGPFVPGDRPAFKDSRSPYCDGLPSPKVPAPAQDFQDGYRDTSSGSSAPGGAASSAAAADPAAYLAGQPSQAGEHAVLAAVTAPVLGVPVDAVPDLVDLLFGPMARGTEVGLS